MQASLILENGAVFLGQSIGEVGKRVCELVFNTSMTGYQEILTDPSYAGQGVVMSYPLIGNYGVNDQDNESGRPWAEALIVRHLSALGSNFRCQGSLDAYLKQHHIVGVQGVDTRALTRILRSQGTMNGMITCGSDFSVQEALEEIRAYRVAGTVERVTRAKPEVFPAEGTERFKVALMDFGVKQNMITCLTKRGCSVTVFPAHTPASDILRTDPDDFRTVSDAFKTAPDGSGTASDGFRTVSDGFGTPSGGSKPGFDGVMLSNGPGDPADNVEIIGEIRKIFDSNLPIFAVCLGHQLLALATGAKTHKMPFGHRGGNHPVKDLKAGRCFITSQNHGYVVTPETVDPAVAEISHVNVNDGTVEGLRYRRPNCFTVQFHPEAAPGPMDTEYLFDEFLRMMGGGRDA